MQMNPMMMAAMQQPQWGSYMAPPMMPMFNPYAAMMPQNGFMQQPNFQQMQARPMMQPMQQAGQQ